MFIQIIHNGDLNLGIIMLVLLLLVNYALLRNLLVVHGILSLIDGERSAYLLHCRFCSLLAEIELNFRDVLNLCLHELLMEGWRRR